MPPSSAATATATTVNGDLPSFIPAKAWQGSKPGYYFGTTKEKGLGYHLDEYQVKRQKKSILNTTNGTSSSLKHKAMSPVDRPSAKRAKRSVVIAEDQNQVRTIPNNMALLQQAEEAAKNTKVLDLTPKGVQNAITNLQKANAKNQLSRSQHPDEPQLYMDSELALYEAITALQPIASDPTNLYPPLLPINHNRRTATADTNLWTDTLSQLCMHTNSDVVSSVVALLLELLDPSLLDVTLPSSHDTNRPILLLAQATMDNLLELLIANLDRLQQGRASGEEEDNTESDADTTGIGKGVQDVLSLMENLLEMDLILQTTNSNEGDDASAMTLVTSSSSSSTTNNKKKNSDSSVAAKLVQDTPFLPWLFTQVQDSTPSKDRALEILAFLVQREEVHAIHPNWTRLQPYKSMLLDDDDDDNQQEDKKDDGDDDSDKPKVVDGMEILLLHGIAPFRKKQPANETEVEALENAVITVEAAITYSPQNLQAFLDAQGIELVLRCLKEKVHAGGVALKLLDFSGHDNVYQKAAEHLVADASGLKYLFPLYMGRQIPKPAIMSWSQQQQQKNQQKKASAALSKAKKEWLHSIENQTIRVLYALTRHLTQSSPQDAQQRLLAKFLDDDKCDRLVELCLAYDQRARMAEFKFWKSDVEDELDADDEAVQLAALEAKLRGGGDIFHRLGAIAGFACVGSKRCHQRIVSQLSLQQSGIAVVKAALEEFISVLGPGKQANQLQKYYDGI